MDSARRRGIGMTSPRTRDRLASRLQAAGIRDERVLEQIRQVPRHLFVEEALASRAYEDTALPIGFSQTISQPYVVARMTEALMQTSGPMKRVLEIGTGSGYQTAILSRLVEEVWSLERVERLLRLAHWRLDALDLDNVTLCHADGFGGLPEQGPWDGILVTAAPEGIPRALVRQLRIGGCMVLPVGDQQAQGLVRLVRTEAGYQHEFLERVSFVPLIGGVC